MKKQSKGVPTNRDIRWDRLDNTAHLFPVIAGESMSNVYRISVTLKEEINPEFQLSFIAVHTVMQAVFQYL